MLSRNFSRCHHILINTSLNPHLNLAKEIDLFNSSSTNEKILYLWRNSPVVVIGKHQNPYKECNLDFMEKNGVKLARRPTGGGAVYQDLGNTCWTFLSPNFEPAKNISIICNSLNNLGIKATSTGRNDIEVSNKKVSGSAFRITQNNSIHHGTMLINVDTNKLTQCLTVRDLKLEAKGVNSVRSRVTNLTDINPNITHDMFCKSIINEFQKINGKCIIETINEQQLLKENSVKKIYDNLRSYKWLYGNFLQNFETKLISKKFDFGLFDVEMLIENGKIKNCTSVSSDCLENDVVEAFEKYLKSVMKQKKILKKLEKEFMDSMKTKKKSKFANELVKWANTEIFNEIN